MNVTRRPHRTGWMLAGLLVSLAAGTGSAVVWAQQGSDPAGPCLRGTGFLTDDDREALRRIFLKRAQERLGLSDQQAGEIQATLGSMRDDARGDIRALCEARQERRALLARQDSDPTALRSAADRVKALQGTLLDRRVEAQLSLRSKLTPEQWAKWLEIRKEMGRRMGRARVRPS